ncbi:putative transposase [Raoultella ornithinolytica]|nr:putative transposase [Raoultella ornithinolytica]
MQRSPAPLMQVNLLRQGTGGRPDQAMDSRLAPQPACATGASIKHRSSRCRPSARQPPCSSACSLAETRLGAPRRRFPEAAQANVRNCPVVAADRVPESGRNTSVAPDNVVQQYPSGQHTFPTPPPKAMAHQADFPCALSAVPTANLSRLRSFRSVLNPVPPSQTSPWATASMPPRPQMDSAAYPENHGYPASVHPVAFFKCSAWVRILKRAAAIMSLIQSARNNGHDPYAYLKDVLTRLPSL